MARVGLTHRSMEIRDRHPLLRQSRVLKLAPTTALKSKASCKAVVGHSGKHSLQSEQTPEAISVMKLISRVGPRLTKPTAFFCLIKAQ